MLVLHLKVLSCFFSRREIRLMLKYFFSEKIYHRRRVKSINDHYAILRCGKNCCGIDETGATFS